MAGTIACSTISVRAAAESSSSPCLSSDSFSFSVVTTSTFSSCEGEAALCGLCEPGDGVVRSMTSLELGALIARDGLMSGGVIAVVGGVGGGVADCTMFKEC